MLRFIALLVATLPAFASTVTNAQIGGLGTTVVSASAQAYYNPCAPTICPVPDPSAIVASATAEAFTLGPVRAGFLEFTAVGAAEFGHSNGSIGNFSVFCANEAGCNPQIATVPFTLGVPFEIDIDSVATILLSNYGSAGVNFQFSLAESYQGAPGAFVVIYQGTPATVPEPATFAAVGLGLLGLAKIYAARSTGSALCSVLRAGDSTSNHAFTLLGK